MIQLTLNEWLLLYAATWLLLSVYLWFREMRRTKRADWELSKGRLFSCDNCRHTFIDKEMRTVARCPKCNSMCILRKVQH